MFFIFSKILHFFLEPLSWVFFVLIVGIVIKDQRRKIRLLKWALGVLFVISNPFLSNEFARIWEFKPRVIEENTTFKAGIVLGGMCYKDKESGNVIFKNGTDRLMQALKLYHEKKIEKIIISGGSGMLTDTSQKEAVFIYEYLQSIQFPMQDVIIESKSRNTRENAKYTKQMIDSLQWQEEKFLLITSANHMKRAKGCFNKVKILSSPYPVDRIAFGRRYNFETLFVPDMHAIFVWRQFLHEIIGYITYKMAGYI